MTPDFDISIDGASIKSTVKPFQSRISVSDAIGIELDKCTVVLASNKIAVPTREALISVQLGYEGSPLFPVFQGYLNKFSLSSPGDQLTIEASGLPLAEHHQLQSVNTRTWFEKPVEDIASEVIRGAGFTPRVHKSIASNIVLRAMQSVQTDIEFLQELAKANGAILKSDGQIIAMLPEDSQETASGTDLPSFDSGKISNYTYTRYFRRGYRQVAAIYQDTESGDIKTATAGSETPRLTLKKVYGSEDEARRAARGKLQRVEKTHEIQARLPGDPQLIAGATWNLSGMDNEILNGEWRIQRLRHTLSKGYVTAITAVK